MVGGSDQHDLGDDDPKYVVQGVLWDVAMRPRTMKDFDKLPTASRAALEKIMEILSEVGPRNMPPTQVKSEGSHPRGDGKKVLIRAIKDGQVRIYGGRVTISKKPTFICTEMDEAKKRRNADQEKLKRAAKYLRPYFEKFGDETEGAEDGDNDGPGTEQLADGAKEKDADEKRRTGGKGKGARGRGRDRRG